MTVQDLEFLCKNGNGKNIYLLATFPKNRCPTTSKFWTLWVIEKLHVVPLKMLNFPNFGRHLEFWQKLKMSFISKTLRDRVISSKVWTLWVLETLYIVPVKKVKFPEFCPPSWILAEIENVVYLENRKG